MAASTAPSLASISVVSGAGGGRAVAELLFGKASPSGKLPVTFYHNEALSEMPAFTDYSMKDRTYRYYGGTPLYPFGYGLTYGKCTVREIKAGPDTVTVLAKNDGSADTEDVLEIYIKDTASPFAPPNPVLCGFRRIRLAAGEEAQYTIPLGDSAFTVVNDEGKRIPGSGNYTVYAGFGGPDPRTEELTGTKALTAVISR